MPQTKTIADPSGHGLADQKPSGTKLDKGRYHHGDLRSCLISAALTLVETEGADACTLKAASQMAGVSVAAPYRHFSDKSALLAEVAVVGFARLNNRCVAARDRYPAGSVDGLSAMGKAYVHFAGDHPHLFRLMFDMRGKQRDLIPGEAENPACPQTQREGHAAFEEFLATVGAVIKKKNGPESDLMRVAMPLWSMVHGAASLLIDNGFVLKAPGIVTDDVVEIATRNFFLGYVTDLNQ